MSAWLTVVGIGEDGADGLGAAARASIDGAELVVGGERHLALVSAPKAVRLPWKQPLTETAAAPSSCWRAAIHSITAWPPCFRGI